MSINQKATFEKVFPNGFYIDEHYQGLEQYLKRHNVIASDDRIATVEKAGEGNMNLTLRVITAQALSVVVKQGRPWVEKYPQIEAPAERTLVEADFYKAVQSYDDISKRMPRVSLIDRASGIIVLSDLGSLTPLDSLYKEDGTHYSTDVWKHLGEWLGTLHATKVSAEFQERFKNRAMRELNHLHIFKLPFQPDNGIALDNYADGLQEAAQFIFRNTILHKRIVALGEMYLADGEVLSHGDYYPGSWLLNDVERPFIIDPEFCFLGNHPEFDLSVTYAHFHICGITATAWQPFWEAYCNSAATTPDVPLLKAFAGVELLRRLLGVAQLPIAHTAEQRFMLLQEAASWIMP